MTKKSKQFIHCALCPQPAKADNEIPVSALGVGTVSVFFCKTHFAEVLQPAREQATQPAKEDEQWKQRGARRKQILELALEVQGEPPTDEELHEKHKQLIKPFISKGGMREQLLPLAAQLYINALLIEWEAKQRGLDAQYVQGTLFTIGNKDIKIDEIQGEALKIYGHTKTESEQQS